MPRLRIFKSLFFRGGRRVVRKCQKNGALLRSAFFCSEKSDFPIPSGVRGLLPALADFLCEFEGYSALLVEREGR